MSTRALKSNLMLGTHLHAMIRTHHFDFDIRFWPISALTSKTKHWKKLMFRTFSGMCSWPLYLQLYNLSIVVQRCAKKKVIGLYHWKCITSNIWCTRHRTQFGRIFRHYQWMCKLNIENITSNIKKLLRFEYPSFILITRSNLAFYLTFVRRISFRCGLFSTFDKVLKPNIEFNSTICIFRDRVIWRRKMDEIDPNWGREKPIHIF